MLSAHVDGATATEGAIRTGPGAGRRLTITQAASAAVQCQQPVAGRSSAQSSGSCRSGVIIVECATTITQSGSADGATFDALYTENSGEASGNGDVMIWRRRIEASGASPRISHAARA